MTEVVFINTKENIFLIYIIGWIFVSYILTGFVLLVTEQRYTFRNAFLQIFFGIPLLISIGSLIIVSGVLTEPIFWRVLLIIIVNSIIATIVGNYGKYRNIGFWNAFFASFFLTPILAMLFVLASDKKN